MNFKHFIGAKLILLFGIIVLAAGMSSCKDDVGPAIAEIKVVDSLGNAVPFANLTMVCTSSTNPPRPCDIEIQTVTSESGKYRKEFEHPSVLRVIASSIQSDTVITGVLPDTTQVISRDSLCGETFITIKEDETNTKTVVVYVCK